MSKKNKNTKANKNISANDSSNIDITNSNHSNITNSDDAETKNFIIFHRPKGNEEECLAHQQKFLQEYEKHFAPPIVIEFTAGEQCESHKILKLVTKTKGKKIFIFNSSLSQKDFRNQCFYGKTFDAFSCALHFGKVYLMDHEGRLYQEINNIKDLEVNHD